MAHVARCPRLILFVVAVLASCGRGRAAPEAHSADPSSKRTLASGEVVGFVASNDKAHAWLGIPFAKPPVGALRWRPPEPALPWKQPRAALAYGSSCPQTANTLNDGPDAKLGTVSGNEDCLYLNVYAPRGTADAMAQRKLPVMVWLHGGGNSVGHAGPANDGSELAARYQLVVVTTNYRLGPLGWFRHPALVAGLAGDQQSGNWGTLDQIRALEWVRQNVVPFGGDPENVTVFGESAGASDVFSLLASPRAAGLFERAIAESGGTHTVSLAEAQNLRDDAEPGATNSSAEASLRILFPGVARKDALARMRALAPEDVAARLRAASPDAIVRAYAGSGARIGGMLDMPILIRDGSTLPLDDLPQLFRAGQYNRVPVILGTNRDELKLFLMADESLVRRWVRPLPMVRDETKYQVISDIGSLSWKMSGADAPAAAMRAAQGPNVYVYRFDWDEEPKILWSDFSKLLGASHGMEISFVFLNFDRGGFQQLFTADNRNGREALADAMSSYWANFAYTGTPGRGRSEKLVEWTPVDPKEGGEKQIVFDTSTGGGVRMDRFTVTKPLLLAKLAHDPRTDEAFRCQTFADMLRRGTVEASDREAAGCSEAVVHAARTAR